LSHTPKYPRKQFRCSLLIHDPVIDFDRGNTDILTWDDFLKRRPEVVGDQDRLFSSNRLLGRHVPVYEDSFHYVRKHLFMGKDGWDVGVVDGKDAFAVFSVSRKVTGPVKVFKPLGDPDLMSKVGKGSVGQLYKWYAQALGWLARRYPDREVSILGIPNARGVHKLVPFGYHRGLEQQIYDIKNTDLDVLPGRRWKNVRNKISVFQKSIEGADDGGASGIGKGSSVEMRNLDGDTLDVARDFVIQWRQRSLDGSRFRFSDISPTLWALDHHSSNRYDDAWGGMMFMDGRVISVQLAFGIKGAPRPSASHVVGISDIQTAGTAEFAQVEFWKQLKRHGIEMVNDGPSWSASQLAFKKKFSPASTTGVYSGMLDLKRVQPGNQSR